MARYLILFLVTAGGLACRADAFVSGPTLPPGPIGGPTETGTIYPFLIKQTDLSPIPIFSMRYQQVYNRSLFTNLDPNFIYVTTLAFSTDPTDPRPVLGWTVPNMQINLSTTTNSADNLSSVFGENVGPDDMVVFGPASFDFDGSTGNNRVEFNRPFRYNPALGNLLMDVRIFDGRGSLDPVNPTPQFLAYDSPTDEVSRVWATNVMAATASARDTIGIWTSIQLSPVPSLYLYASYFGTPTNYIAIEWPTQPPVFILQRSAVMGSNAAWQNVITTGVFSNATYQRYFFPAGSAGLTGFYRLFWSGQ